MHIWTERSVEIKEGEDSIFGDDGAWLRSGKLGGGLA